MSSTLDGVIEAWRQSIVGDSGFLLNCHIVAIDFGTSTSGYAFQIKGTDAVHVNSTWGGVACNYGKTITALLLDQNGNLLKFGEEAQQAYLELPDEEAHSMLYFQKFKMLLYSLQDKKTPLTQMTLEAANGKRVDAVTVFAASLRFMKEDFLSKVKESTGANISADDVLWVVTVPAIWDQQSKAFMRAAAVQAGLISSQDDQQLLLALEPEAASIYCQQLPAKEFGASSLANLETDDKQLIVDVGGGTVDITVHQLDSDLNLEEVHKATGGSWGGDQINVQILQFFESLFEGTIMHKFKKTFPDCYVEQEHNIETGKILWKYAEEKPLRITLHPQLLEIVSEEGKTVSSIVEKYRTRKESKDISYRRGAVVIGKDDAKQLFDKEINTMINHLTTLLKMPSVVGARRMYLVGGFSQCRYLQHRVKEAFATVYNLEVLTPLEGGTAVLKGAVMFGRNPAAIRQRIAQYTYGWQALKPYQQGDLPSDKVVIDGHELCKDAFNTFIAAGSRVGFGDIVRDTCYPSSVAQTTITVPLYASPERDVLYTTDEDCRMIAKVTIHLPSLAQRKDGCTEVVMCFGQTEMHVAAINHKTLDFVSVTLDFLNNSERSAYCNLQRTTDSHHYNILEEEGDGYEHGYDVLVGKDDGDNSISSA